MKVAKFKLSESYDERLNQHNYTAAQLVEDMFLQRQLCGTTGKAKNGFVTQLMRSDSQRAFQFVLERMPEAHQQIMHRFNSNPMQKNRVIAHLLNRWGLIEHCLVKAYGEVDTAMAFGFVMRQRARRGIKCVVRLFFRRNVFERNNMSEPLKDKYVEL